MTKEEFRKLKVGDIVKWSDQHKAYALLIKELNIGTSPNLRHAAIVLTYTGTDPNHWKSGQTAEIYEFDDKSLAKVA